MRTNLGPKAMLYPQPVLIIGTYNEDETPNAMNAAWGGISEEDEVSICVSAEHKTTKNLLRTGAFTVSCADVKNVAEADYVGLVSGNKEPDKLAKTGWTAQKGAFVDAPIFRELPFALECRVRSYDAESCRLVGEIVNISVDDAILTDGKVDLGKFSPIVYDSHNHHYVALGEVVGNAFKDGRRLMFEFRDIRREESEQAIEIEQICFPPHEACSPESMTERIAAAPEVFLVAVDRQTGRLAGLLNGISTDELVFRDEFFTDARLHNPQGGNVMLLGLDVLPEYRGRGLARELIHQYRLREAAKGRKKLILTCLDAKVEMYQKLGFTDLGISNSTWGNEQWHEMSMEIGG